MPPNAYEAFRQMFQDWRRRNRTRDDFADGSSLSEIHRMGIRYSRGDGAFVDIGYEAAGGGGEWLIHEQSIDTWEPNGREISGQEKKEIIGRLMEYGQARRRVSRVVA